jgi:hypothetical protein
VIIAPLLRSVPSLPDQGQRTGALFGKNIAALDVDNEPMFSEIAVQTDFH